MELLQVVTPKTVDKFVGNKIAIRNIREFLTQKQNDATKNMLCIMGPDGCGKSILAKLFLEQFNFQVLEVGRDSLNGQDIKAALSAFANNNTIDYYISKRTKIVLVEDLDILCNVDKLLLSKILSSQQLLRAKGIKVVITTNIGDEKRCNEHAKDMEIVKLYHPPAKESYVYIMNAFDDGEIPYEPEALLKIVTKCKGSIRQSIMSLESTEGELQLMCDEMAFKDLNNFEICKRILERRYTKKELDYIMYSDPGVIPFMLYENMPDELDTNFKFERGKGKATLQRLYLDMNKAYINGSLLEDKAFSGLDWTYLGYANVLKLETIHALLHHEGIQKKATQKDVKYRFSQLLSKISHKNILAKKIRTISSNVNVSNTAVINATDFSAQTEGKERKATKATKGAKSVKAVKAAKSSSQSITVQEETSVFNTYEKYFV